MRSVSGDAAASAKAPPQLSLVGSLFGMLLRPRQTLRVVASSPRWAAVILVTTMFAILPNAAVMTTPIGQQALVDQWERTALAFGQTVDDARYAQFEAWSQRGPLYAVGTGLVMGPIATVAVAGLIVLVFGGARRGVTITQALAVAAHAGVILALRQVIAAPVAYTRETLASATTLGVLSATFDESSPVARFFGAMDIFVLWWIAVLAIGIAVLYQQRARRVGLVLTGAYAALALLMTAAIAVASAQ